MFIETQHEVFTSKQKLWKLHKCNLWKLNLKIPLFSCINVVAACKNTDIVRASVKALQLACKEALPASFQGHDIARCFGDAKARPRNSSKAL